MKCKILLFFILSVAGDCCAGLLNETECETANDSYAYFGTKTPYDVVRGSFRNNNDCSAVQMWLLGRHGTRFHLPNEANIMKRAATLRREILANYAENGTDAANVGIGTRLCDAALSALEAWRWDARAERRVEMLNERGRDELGAMGARFADRYPALFANSARSEDGGRNADNFYFGHAEARRTEDSCHAFVEGAFREAEAGKQLCSEKPVDGVFLSLKSHCPAAANEVLFYKVPQFTVFLKSKRYKQLASDVSRRLGYDKILETFDIVSMHKNCAYDKSRYPDRPSAWCGVFTEEELAVMEYGNDIRSFYKTGPGGKYAARLGCPPLMQLLDVFSATVENGFTNTKVIAMFTHDVVLDMTFTALGYNDDGRNLDGSNYRDLLLDRRYRSTWLTPFAANIAAVLHRCPNRDEQYEVQLLHNERPMEISGCPKGLCPWSHFKNMLSFTNGCDLDFCTKTVNK